MRRWLRRVFVVSVLGGVLALFVFFSCTPDPLALNNRANRLSEAQDYAQALRDYEIAQALEPDEALYYFNAASALAEDARLDEAILHLEQVLLRDDGDLIAEAYYNLGSLHVRRAEYEAAVIAYREALRAQPDFADARYNLEIAMRYIPTATPTPLEQATSTPSLTPTQSPSPSPTGTLTTTATATAPAQALPTNTLSPTPSETPNGSPSPTGTSSTTPTPDTSHTPDPSITPSLTPTFTATTSPPALTVTPTPESTVTTPPEEVTPQQTLVLSPTITVTATQEPLGAMSREDAERILNAVQSNQRTLREVQPAQITPTPATSGNDKDW